MNFLKKLLSKTKIPLIGIFLLILFLIFFNHEKAKLENLEKIPENFEIFYNLNFYQSFNNCGPYNTAAVLRSFGENISSEKFAEEMKFRLSNNYTLPIGMEKQLKDSGLKIRTPNVKKFNESEKINFLKQELSKGNPIIILGGLGKYQHYITLFGFDSKEKVFFVYDSIYKKGQNGFTIDSNGEKPGNRNFDFEELYDFWKNGGMFGFYNFYLIIVGK